MTKTLMTADELLHMPDDGYRYELVKGELLRMAPAGFEHGTIVANFTVALGRHVNANKPGVLVGAETGFRITSDPDTVRAPDLAVEVISPGDTYTEVEDKVQEWLDAGTRMVIVANPRNRTLKVHRSRIEVILLMENEELDGGDVVPGFRVKVSELFS